MEARRRALRQVASQLRQARQQFKSCQRRSIQQQHSLQHQNQHQNQLTVKAPFLAGVVPSSSCTPTAQQKYNLCQVWGPQNKNVCGPFSPLSASLAQRQCAVPGKGSFHAAAAPLLEPVPAQPLLRSRGEPWKGVAAVQSARIASSAAQAATSSESKDGRHADSGGEARSEQGAGGGGGAGRGQSRRGWWWFSAVTAAAFRWGAPRVIQLDHHFTCVRSAASEGVTHPL